MDHSDIILALDRQQGMWSDSKRVCPVDDDHGALGVHKSGVVLLCTNAKCNYSEPVSIVSMDSK